MALFQSTPLAVNQWAGNQFVPAPVNWVPRPKPLYQEALEKPIQTAAPPASGQVQRADVGNGNNQPQQAAPAAQPGSYNTGRAAGLAGSFAPVPGLGMAMGIGGTLMDNSRMNRDLNAIGLKGGNSAFDALLGNATFGMFGQSPQSYFDLMTAGVPYSTLQQIAGVAPPTSLTPQMAQSAGTASLDFFGGINDMNNVGRLGEVLNELDAARGGGGGGAGTNGTTGGAVGGGSGVNAPDQPGNANGIYRYGGKIPHDGDGKLEPVNVTAHEGEYVVKPESTKHYGKGLLDAINEQKIDKKKLKGLLSSK